MWRVLTLLALLALRGVTPAVPVLDEEANARRHLRHAPPEAGQHRDPRARIQFGHQVHYGGPKAAIGAPKKDLVSVSSSLFKYEKVENGSRVRRSIDRASLHTGLDSSHAVPSSGAYASEAAEAGSCAALLQPVLLQRSRCLLPRVAVHICVDFDGDYGNLFPFLLHHLSVGVETVWVFNYEHRPWYQAPAVLCLVARDLVHIQPWRGRDAQDRANARAQCAQLVRHVAVNTSSAASAWISHLEVDEYLVVPSDPQRCVNKVVHKRPVAGLVLPIVEFAPPEPGTVVGVVGLPWPPLQQQMRVVGLGGHKVLLRANCAPDVSSAQACGFSSRGVRDVNDLPLRTNVSDALADASPPFPVQLNKYLHPGREPTHASGLAMVEDGSYRAHFLPWVTRMVQACPQCFVALPD